MSKRKANQFNGSDPSCAECGKALSKEEAKRQNICGLCVQAVMTTTENAELIWYGINDFTESVSLANLGIFY